MTPAELRTFPNAAPETKAMNDLITQSYWLLFDYIKPCLLPIPTVEYTPFTVPFDDINSPYQSSIITAKVSFELTVTFQGMQHWETLRKVDNCQNMMNFINNPAGLTATITCLFSELKNHGEYEVFLSVLKNMILAGKITKDECIKILSEAECYEAVVELLQFDTKENQAERFNL